MFVKNNKIYFYVFTVQSVGYLLTKKRIKIWENKWRKDVSKDNLPI